MIDRVVVDSSVVVKWFVVESDSAGALRLFDAYVSEAVELLAPSIFHAEIGNIFWKKQALQGTPAREAREAIDDILGLSISLTPIVALFDDAYRLATAHRRSFYDSLYLALSLRERCRFVTADQKLLNAIGTSFPNITWVGRWP